MNENAHKVEKVRVGGLNNRAVLDVVDSRRFVDEDEAREQFNELKAELDGDEGLEARLKTA